MSLSQPPADNPGASSPHAEPLPAILVAKFKIGSQESDAAPMSRPAAAPVALRATAWFPHLLGAPLRQALKHVAVERARRGPNPWRPRRGRVAARWPCLGCAGERAAFDLSLIEAAPAPDVRTTAVLAAASRASSLAAGIAAALRGHARRGKTAGNVRQRSSLSRGAWAGGAAAPCGRTQGTQRSPQSRAPACRSVCRLFRVTVQGQGNAPSPPLRLVRMHLPHAPRRGRRASMGENRRLAS
eukprot:361367-Chlamydomonas_euryale.AAC.9